MKIPKELCERILAWEEPVWKHYTGAKTRWASHHYYFIDANRKDLSFLHELLGHLQPLISDFQITYSMIRLTKYETGDYIGMHQDVGDLERKLTIVIQLSDPKDYEGGDLVVEGVTADKEQGSVLTHDPMKDWHEVKPVTKGTRYTLVLWLK